MCSLGHINKMYSVQKCHGCLLLVLNHGQTNPVEGQLSQKVQIHRVKQPRSTCTFDNPRVTQVAQDCVSGQLLYLYFYQLEAQVALSCRLITTGYSVECISGKCVTIGIRSICVTIAQSVVATTDKRTDVWSRPSCIYTQNLGLQLTLF